MSRTPMLWLLALVVATGAHTPGKAQIPDPCIPYFILHADVTPAPLFVCPQRDTDSFIDQGWWLEIYMLDVNHQPIPGIPASDFWLIDCDPNADASLCGGSASSDADSATGENGRTTMSLSKMAAGGCSDGIAVVGQSFVILDSTTHCTDVQCAPISLRSPDIDGSLEVNLVDLSIFAGAFPPQPYDTCSDFDLNGVVGLVDVALFAMRFGPPGHACF